MEATPGNERKTGWKCRTRVTTIRAAGHSVQDGDVRHFGMSKEGVVARQFMLGVVQTADGMPIYHEVFDGNTSEAPTLLPTVRKVSLFGIKEPAVFGI